jgi:hypothetical protein
VEEDERKKERKSKKNTFKKNELEERVRKKE